MRAQLACALAVFGLSLSAATADERALNGSEITGMLEGATVSAVDASWSQSFHADGTTDYLAERPSSGVWSVRGAQYCSQWPPAESWACYRVTHDAAAGTITWIAKFGERTTGKLQGP